MARVAIAAPQVETYEVDLWGTVFEARPATRSVSRKGAPLVAKLADILDEPNNGDDAVRLYGEILDLRLSPTNGGRTKASTVIKRKWEGDEVTISQLDQLLSDLAEADRPT